MKKLLFIFTFLLCAIISFCQSGFPNNQTISNNATLYHAKGGLMGDSGLVNVSFPDTATANLGPYIKNTNSIQIRVHDTIFIRDLPTYTWVKFSTNANVNPNGCISGKQFGDVVWDSLLVFHSTLMDYYIGCRHFTAAPTDFTLAPAFPSNPRVDVWVVDTFGVIRVVTGSISGLAYQPNPASELQVAQATIAAGATVPSGISNLSVYKENVHPPEWTGASVVSGVLFNYAINPFLGDSSTYIPSFVNGDIVNYQDLINIYDVNDFSFLKFYVRLGAVMNSGDMNVTFYNGAVQATSTITIQNGQYGFNSTLVGTYQLIAIPFSDFLKIYPFQVNLVQFQFTGTGGSLQFDNIVLQAGGQGVGTSGVIDITGNSGSTRSGHYVIQKPDIGWFYDSTSLNSDSTYEYHWNNGVFLDSVYNPHDLIFGSSSVTIIPSTVGFRRAYTFTANGGGTGLFYDSTSINFDFTKYLYYSGGVVVDSIDIRFGVNLGNTNLVQSDPNRSFNMVGQNLSFINTGSFNVTGNTPLYGLHVNAIGNQINDGDITAYGSIYTASQFFGPGASPLGAPGFFLHANSYPIYVTNGGGPRLPVLASFAVLSDVLSSTRGSIPYPAITGADKGSMLFVGAEKDYGISVYNKSINELYIGDSSVNGFRRVMKENENGNVVVGDTLDTHLDALLQAISTTKGVLFSPMNTTQMNAISSPSNGLMIYNTDSACYCSYTGSAWVKMCGGSGGGGTVYSASNGLDLVGTTFELGGSSLNHTTDIDLDGNKFSFSNISYNTLMFDPSSDTFAIRQVHNDGSEDLIKLGDDGSGSALIQIRVNDVANGNSGDYNFQSGGVTLTSIETGSNKRSDFNILAGGLQYTFLNTSSGTVGNIITGFDGSDHPYMQLSSQGVSQTSIIEIKDTGISIHTPALWINDVPYGGGSGSSIYTSNGSLTGDRTVDLAGFTLYFGTGAPLNPLSISDTIVSMTTTDGIGTSAFIMRAKPTVGYQTVFFSTDGVNTAMINLNAGVDNIAYNSSLHTFTGNIEYVNPPAGTGIDDVLTWRTVDGIITKRPVGSFISSHQVTGQEFTGSTSTTLTLSQNYISGSIKLFKNGVRLLIADFTEATANTITLNVARLTGDVFQTDFNY